jgi:flagellar basal-body rod modification protein FlgD
VEQPEEPVNSDSVNADNTVSSPPRQPETLAQNCPSGDPTSINYIRRDNNRCEGIKRQTVSGSLSLISFTSRNIGDYGDTLTLEIPRLPDLSNQPPRVRVQAMRDRYLLNDIEVQPHSDRYQFSWSTYVLRNADISPSALRAIASLTHHSQPVYVPVILGQASGQYEFVFFTASHAKFPKLAIVRNGRTLHSQSIRTRRSGEVRFTWNPGNAPAGRYELHVVAEIEPFGSPPEKVTRRIAFQHNPDWL